MPDPHALIQEGLGALNSGDTDTAARLFKKALPYNPGDAELLHLTALAYIRGGRRKVGQGFLLKALKQTPGHADSNNTMAVLLLEDGRTDKAITALETALRSEPDNIRALRNLGKVLRDVDRLDEALVTYQKLGELLPEDGSIQNVVGTLLMNRGDFSLAKDHLRRSVTLDPDHGGSWLLLVELNGDISDADIEAMRQALQRQLQMPQKGQQMATALFRVFEARKDYKTAGPFLLLSNDLRSRADNHDISIDEEKMSRIAAFTGPEFINGPAPDPVPGPAPVFVLGLPRSGTTLVEQILSCHSQVAGAGERGSVGRSLRRLTGDRQATFPDNLGRLKKADFAKLCRYIVEILQDCVEDEKYVIDKTPQNFLYVGLIKRLWPDSRIIHCRRNLMDCGWSNYKTPFGEGNNYSCNQEDLVRYFRAKEKLMAHWQDVCPDGFLDVDYEDIVADQEGQTRRLLDYCGLGWEDACLDFHKSDRSVRTASSVQVRSPIYNTSLKAWEPYREFLQPLLDGLDDG